MLGGLALEAALEAGDLKCYRNDVRIPASELEIGPNSIDVTLGGLFYQMDRRFGTIDTHNDLQEGLYYGFEADMLIIQPGELYLAHTQERFEIDGCFAPMLEGRSTLARLGLCVHQTAGFGDHGFSGAFTLELTVSGPNPIMLRKGDRVAQVFWQSVVMPKTYKGVYSLEDHYNKPVTPVTGITRM